MRFIKNVDMPLNQQDSLNNSRRLFHISEDPGIAVFEPRPSPSNFEALTGDCVYAISGKLLHNYLLPRDCPRVTYYLNNVTTDEDKDKFFGASCADNVVIVESRWFQRILDTKLYCYEFSPVNFTLLDECAQYYVSYKPETPLSVTTINNAIHELLCRNIELRFTPSLIDIGNSVAVSGLNFSMIRMRNVKG